MKKKTTFKGCLLLLLLFVILDNTGFGQEALCGDINGSGVTDIVDALLIAQCYVGQTQCASANIADVNCNGSIDIIDALLVAQYYVNILSQLDCCGATPGPNLNLTCYIEFNPSIYPNNFHYPQFCLWVKDIATSTLYSCFITNFSARLSESTNNYRPYALPVWFGERITEKRQNSYPEIDAISKATPLVDSTIISWQLPAELMNKDLEVYFEGNISYDYNDYYTFNPNGQPSLIWMAVMNTQNYMGPIQPPIIGHGDLLGEDNLIHTEGMPNITDAKDIFKKIVFEFAE